MRRAGQGNCVKLYRGQYNWAFADSGAGYAARFAHFFSVSTISLNSASTAELGLMVALRVALRNTCTICRNDHSLSQAPIRPRSSCASGSAWPAVTYQTMMTDCIDHTHGATFSTLS